MIYKNFEIYNAAELIYNDDGSVSWKRVPSEVEGAMEIQNAESVVRDCTGVELRFVLLGDKATIRMSTFDKSENAIGTFHIYRGGIQGGWTDELQCHVTGNIRDITVSRADNAPKLKEMARLGKDEWDPEVIRVIFDRGMYRIYDVIGEVTPPQAQMCPKKTMISYGSSITHGSNSIDSSHAWVSVVAHNLGMDARNLGMSGHCALEPAMADYIASEGERGAWDIATLELGINVLGWDHEKIISRARNIITEVAGRNPDKQVFVISPFYHCGEYFNPNDGAKKWRKILDATVAELAYPNVTYINGLDAIDSVSYMSADGVHPNIYGAQRIADFITERIRSVIS